MAYINDIYALSKLNKTWVVKKKKVYENVKISVVVLYEIFSLKDK